ncbi:MAG: hypothetical protein JJV98_20225 [Desulfosarcina sp.]|nr:hypothetical protein [Desulfobacterales bacterium]
MPVHPLLTATLVMDTLVLGLLTGAALAAFQVALHWTPDDTGRRQLKLQSRQEAWSLAASIATWVYLAAGILLIWLLTNILPGLVPGAMCGTGVLQSCNPHGHRMLAFRLIGTVGLLCWQRMEALNRTDPLASLTATNARVLLMLLPILVLGYAESFLTLVSFDTGQPVNCCTALYDRIAALPAAEPSAARGSCIGLALFLVTTAVLPFLTQGSRPESDKAAPRRAAAMLAVATLWLVSGAVTLVRILAPYHYEVLHHYCPWCFFLPEHGWIGFPLLLSWGLVAVEAPAQWALVKAQPRLPEASRESRALMRRSRRRLLFGILGFGLLAAGPALWWRWQYGLWIGG